MVRFERRKFIGFDLRANAHKNQTKSNFFGKARKLKFAHILHIASPWQEWKQAVVFSLK